jgi:fatty acid desaturase
MLDQPAPCSSSRSDSDYAVLLAEVRAAGLLKRSMSGYLPRLAGITLLIAAGGCGLFLLGDSRWQLALAAYSGVVLGQLAFLGHDAGHQQLSSSRRCNDAFGLVLATLGVGLSYGWWVDKHNRHHRHPNQLGRDPDVERGVLAWTGEQADRQRGVFRLIARHQAGLFLPLLLLEAWNLHVSSVRAILRRRAGRGVEASLLVLHCSLGLTALLLVLSPLRALEFVAVQQSVLGVYIGVSFAPNHKGMPLIDQEARLGFMQRQLLTSRNVAGGRALALIFGALNYQIEHHLFPSMPSRNLGRCQPIVRAFCASRSLPYVQTDLMESYSRSFRYLRGIRPVGHRGPPAGERRGLRAEAAGSPADG